MNSLKMSQNVHSLHLSHQIHKLSCHSSHSPVRAVANQTSAIFKTKLKISRRELAICIGPSLLYLGNPFHLPEARAEDESLLKDKPELQEETSGTEDESLLKDKTEAQEETSGTEDKALLKDKTEAQEETSGTEDESLLKDKTEAQEETSATKSATDSSITKRAYLDISIDGEPVGRIIIGLNESDAPEGFSRFSSLVSGTAGTSYRRKEFVKILPNYVQHGGVRSFGVDAELAKKTGSSLAVDKLVTEWERLNKNNPGTKNVAGSVSIVVRNPSKPPPKMKLVARKGKLEIDEEEVGTDPNGTEFVISSKDSPELDASSLVVGKVLDGMNVVERITKVKTVQENTSSNFFKVAKLIGDKRAVVAERGFNRPYSKVIVTNCDLMD
ncbi:hypothetical protein MKW94_005424 [Papaver nudicaule]|uniref:PPIase cyclophilin-type domain-containing protein n=1 Tax=Papaver nudicaule TaxID=74823 RepID=A0AA41UW37_PAPNU|nr:hypothetical protein [Papaver nudicaule]